MMKNFIFLATLLFQCSSVVMAHDLVVPDAPDSISAFASGALPAVLVPRMQGAQQEIKRFDALRHLAHEEGVSLGIRSRQERYLALTGDVYGKALLIEEIGEAGARAYARRMGYEPLFAGKVGSGKGFDQVYRNPRTGQVIVIEAKGGGSPLKIYRGHMQGTPAYIEAVANAVLADPKASTKEVLAAREVLKAKAQGRLVSKVVRTQHVLGKPLKTQVMTIAGGTGSRPLASQVKAGGLVGVLLTSATDLIGQTLGKGEINIQQNLVLSMLGGAAAYAGVAAGRKMQDVLLSDTANMFRVGSSFSRRAAVGGSIAGGLVGSLIFSYGAYLMGYGDIEEANRNFLIGTSGVAGGLLAQAAVMAAVQTLGTASTGAAISSLSGAAATNAALAWLGGGTVAAGGGGTALGLTILTGGVIIVAFTVSTAVWYMLNWHDEKTEQERVLYNVERLGSSY